MKRAARGLTPHRARSARNCRTSRTASSSRATRTSSACRSGELIHSYDDDAVALWNANFEEGLKIAKAAGAKEVWSGRGNIPTIHLMGGTIMGTGARATRWSTATARPTRLPNLYMAGPGIFSDRGRVEPDLHDLRPVAARCRATGDEVEHGRGMTRILPSPRAARRRPHCGSMPAARTMSAICLT